MDAPKPPSAYDKLTPKQRAFVDFYLATQNATEAARRAGYQTPRQQGSENLSKPVIRAAIDERLAAIEAARQMEANEVVRLLTDHARGTLEDFLDFGKDGQAKEPSLDLKQAKDRGKLHLVRKFKVTTRTSPEGETTKTVELELQPQQEALDKLARVRGLYQDKVKVDGHVSGLANLVESILGAGDKAPGVGD